jgi:hypothetical protein
MEFTGSNSETAWSTVEIDGIEGNHPTEGEADKPKYAYFKLRDSSCTAGKSPTGVISMVYYDNNDGSISAQYDSSDTQIKESKKDPGAWKYAGKIKLKNTGHWSVLEIPVADAFFNGRCNGADIRMNSNDETILGAVYFRMDAGEGP